MLQSIEISDALGLALLEGMSKQQSSKLALVHRRMLQKAMEGQHISTQSIWTAFIDILMGVEVCLDGRPQALGVAGRAEQMLLVLHQQCRGSLKGIRQGHAWRRGLTWLTSPLRM